MNLKIEAVCVVVHVCNPSTQEVESGGLQVPGQSSISRKNGWVQVVHTSGYLGG
jgi:hypothetical protein